MNTKHPESEDLNDYLQQPQAQQFSALRLHLASCGECRTQLEVLSSLRQNYPLLQTVSIDEIQQQEIEDVVNGAGDVSTDNNSALEKIKNNSATLKAALHFASHSAAMSEVIQSEAQQHADQPQKISVESGLKSLLTRLFEYQSPVWIPASISAALVMALAVLIIPLVDSPDKVLADQSIVQYQDNPQIHFRSQDALPGIGFFSRAEEESQPYDGLRVSYIRPGIISLTWPKVDNAKQYKLRLQVIAQGKKNTLAEISTELNQTEIKLNVADINHRYEWTLSGSTRDGKTFITTGGFVIDNR